MHWEIGLDISICCNCVQYRGRAMTADLPYIITTEKVKLSKLTEQDDIEAFLTTFERMMTVHEIRRDKWAYKLTGKAQLAFAAMDPANAGDYAQLKDAILLRYDINEETYRQRFRGAKRKDGETHRELATRLADSVEKWTKECGTVQEVRDLIVKEQLLNALPTDLRIFVSERKPSTSREAGQLADDHIQARRRLPEPSGGEATSEEKHTPEPLRCQACHQVGHTTRECRKTAGGLSALPRETPQRQDRPILRCYNCGGRGHISAKCPSNALYCGSEEPKHSQKRGRVLQEAVRRHGAVEGQRVTDVVLDTGSARTLVRSNLVPGSKQLDSTVAVRCVHGDILVYPLAQVDMEVEGRKMIVEAGVSETLPASVLLGTDVPDLAELLRSSGLQQGEDVMVVTTRAQAWKQQETGGDPVEDAGPTSGESDQTPEEEPLSGSSGLDRFSNPVEPTESRPGWGFDDSLFVPTRARERPTRRQKREGKRSHAAALALASAEGLKLSTEDTQRLQRGDDTPSVRWEVASRQPSTVAGPGLVSKDEGIYRQWTSTGGSKEETVVQVEPITTAFSEYGGESCREGGSQSRSPLPVGVMRQDGIVTGEGKRSVRDWTYALGDWT